MDSDSKDLQVLTRVINEVWVKRYGGEVVTDVGALAHRVASLGQDRDCWVMNAKGLQSEYLRIDAELRGSPPPASDAGRELGARAISAQPGKSYYGEIVAAAVPGRVLQSIGQGTFVSHELARLDALLWPGQKTSVKYDHDGRGKVTVQQREQANEATLAR